MTANARLIGTNENAALPRFCSVFRHPRIQPTIALLFQANVLFCRPPPAVIFQAMFAAGQVYKSKRYRPTGCVPYEIHYSGIKAILSGRAFGSGTYVSVTMVPNVHGVIGAEMAWRKISNQFGIPRYTTTTLRVVFLCECALKSRQLHHSVVLTLDRSSAQCTTATYACGANRFVAVMGRDLHPRCVKSRLPHRLGSRRSHNGRYVTRPPLPRYVLCVC